MSWYALPPTCPYPTSIGPVSDQEDFGCRTDDQRREAEQLSAEVGFSIEGWE